MSGRRIKSFSDLERGPPKISAVRISKDDEGDVDDEEEEEEKMDMLWEDFNNEEFSGRNLKSKTMGDDLKLSPGRNLKLFKANKRQLSVVVFVKVLKKIFLLHNSHRGRPIKKNHQW